MRIQRVFKAACAAVSHGFDGFNSDSVVAFLASPMRADIPKIARAKKPANVASCESSIPMSGRATCATNDGAIGEDLHIVHESALNTYDSEKGLTTTFDGEQPISLSENVHRSSADAVTMQASSESQGEVKAIALGPDESYLKLNSASSKLQALAWCHTYNQSSSRSCAKRPRGSRAI